MNPTTPGRRITGFCQTTNLAEFCQAIRRTHAARLRRQSVSLSCDVARDIRYELPRTLIRRILDAWIVEALNMMPDGGQLDITVVPSSKGLEIEVADSRAADIHETHDYWHRQVQIRDGAVIDAHSGVAIKVEAVRCPQGGVARTVIVPNRAVNTETVLPSPWRRVA